MIEDGDPGHHPGVNIAFGGENFRLVEDDLVCVSTTGHAEVQGRVELRQHVDIVQEVFVIDDHQRLAGAQGEDVRNINALFLIEQGRGEVGRGGGGWSVLEIDDHIIQAVI